MPLPAFDGLFHEGVRLMREGDAAGAAAAFRATLALAPGLAAAHVNLGLLLVQSGSLDEAGHHYRTALACDPAHLQAHLHLGVLLASQKQFTAAESVYRQALQIDPQSPAALSNLGVLLACVQREEEAESCYRHALAIDRGYRNASFNLAYLLLRQGRFDEGWAAFEARDWYARLDRFFQVPRWHGEALAGKSLVIGFEGGHGDMLQFCRYAAVAKTLGAAHVAMVCHPALKTLLARVAAIDTVYGYDEDVPATGWDYWTPPLSFPWALGTRLDTIPASLPYLHAAPGKVAAFAPMLAVAGRRLRVGLAWQGNPHFENDSERSLAAVEVLAPLFALEACFFSLQKGAGRQDAAHPAITDLAPHLSDFDDTAAIVAQLDLVITVDSAVTHLAGALGTPCWVMLPAFKTDWRWLTDRTDSPWYPGVMRLFRQTQAGDWTGVVDAIKSALQDRQGAPS
jgi:tetratricopeptide (TPR) repeat protein